MLQPNNAAVFCWPGATYRWRLRKKRVEKWNFCLLFLSVKLPGTPLPFTLHHRPWHESVHLPPEMQGCQASAEGILRRWWCRFGSEGMEKKESCSTFCIAQVQGNGMEQINHFFVMLCVMFLGLSVKKFPGNMAVIDFILCETSVRSKSSFLTLETAL